MTKQMFFTRILPSLVILICMISAFMGRVSWWLPVGVIVYYTSFGESRCVLVTRVDKALGEFDATLNGTEVWGAMRQVTYIRSTDGTGWSCHNGVAIPD